MDWEEDKMAQPSILLVDDDESLLQLYQAALKRTADFDVFTALTGTAAIRQVRSRRPGLIVLDIMLPDMNGIEICRLLRALPSFDDIPIVMVTGRDSEESRQGAFEAGADDYWVKPIHPSDLATKAVQLIERHVKHGNGSAQLKSVGTDGIERGIVLHDRSAPTHRWPHRILLDDSDLRPGLRWKRKVDSRQITH